MQLLSYAVIFVTHGTRVLGDYSKNRRVVKERQRYAVIGETPQWEKTTMPVRKPSHYKGGTQGCVGRLDTRIVLLSDSETSYPALSIQL